MYIAESLRQVAKAHDLGSIYFQKIQERTNPTGYLNSQRGKKELKDQIKYIALHNAIVQRLLYFVMKALGTRE